MYVQWIYDFSVLLTRHGVILNGNVSVFNMYVCMYVCMAWHTEVLGMDCDDRNDIVMKHP